MNYITNDKEIEELLIDFWYHIRMVNGGETPKQEVIDGVKQYMKSIKLKSKSEERAALHAEVFKLANKLAVAGYGNEAVKMHGICTKINTSTNFK